MSLSLRATLAGTLVSVCMFPALAMAEAQITCAGGAMSHTATAEEAASAQNGGITAGVTQICPNDSRLGVNNDTGAAKQYLRSIVCRGSQFGGTTADETVQKLDNKFAVCAAKFLKAASSQLQGSVQLLNGGSNPVCLREGFRTVAQQNKYADEYRRGGGIACTKGAGCEHPRGIAIDVNTSPDANYPKLWAMGSQFNVNFYLRQRDKVHFVPLRGECSGGGATPADQQLPSTTYDFPQYSQQGGTPFDQQVRQALGMQPPPPPPPPPQQMPQMQQPMAQPTQSVSPSASVPPLGTINTTPQQTGTCQMQTFCAQDGNIYYRSSQCVDQVYQRCPSGCSGATCTGTSTTQASPTGSSGLADILSSGDIGQPFIPSMNATGTATLSAYDLIRMYANASNTPANISTTTTADLSDTIEQLSHSTGVLLAIVPAPTSTESAKGSTVVIVSLPPQAMPHTTFPPVPRTIEPTGDVGSTLSTVELILKNILATFQPFGGRVLR